MAFLGIYQPTYPQRLTKFSLLFAFFLKKSPVLMERGILEIDHFEN